MYKDTREKPKDTSAETCIKPKDDAPDGYIALAMICGEMTSVAFKDISTARAMCVKGKIQPFWTSPSK